MVVVMMSLSRLNAAAALRVSVAALLVLLGGGCVSGPDPLAFEPEQTSSVAVQDNVYRPISIAVDPGTEVTWTWEGQANHNVVYEEGPGASFASELLSEGTFTQTFNEPGMVRYQCTIHSRMNGLVIVGG